MGWLLLLEGSTVRLSSYQVEELVRATKDCFGSEARVWLFGSRVDDAKKGGDIDLYIETSLEEGIVQAKLHWLRALYRSFGEQKIDLIVRSRADEMDPFHTIAKKSAIELTQGQ